MLHNFIGLVTDHITFVTLSLVITLHPSEKVNSFSHNTHLVHYSAPT